MLPVYHKMLYLASYKDQSCTIVRAMDNNLPPSQSQLALGLKFELPVAPV